MKSYRNACRSVVLLLCIMVCLCALQACRTQDVSSVVIEKKGHIEFGRDVYEEAVVRDDQQSEGRGSDGGEEGNAAQKSKDSTPESIGSFYRSSGNNGKSRGVGLNRGQSEDLLSQMIWPVADKELKSYGRLNQEVVVRVKRQNADVKAVADGVAIYIAKDDHGGGFVVIIKHKDGYHTHYRSVENVQISQDQKVRKGDVIAKVGKAGALHFSLEYEGVYIMPRGVEG